MVGDDEINAATRGGFGGGEGANAGIDADDEVDATRGGLLDDLVAHAVAFADAMRHVIFGLAAAQLDDGLEDDDGGSAIDIVVAVNEHGLVALDGRPAGAPPPVRRPFIR